MGEVYELGGRRFVAADLDRRSSLHHHFLRAVTRKCPPPSLPADDETMTSEQWVKVLSGWQEDVIASLSAHRLLSGFLVPEGKSVLDWTPEMASETEAFLKGIRDPESVELVDALVMECLIGFFQRALRPLVHSLKSSGLPGTAGSASSAAH